MGWVVDIVALSAVKKEYEKWHQPLPDVHQIHDVKWRGGERATVKAVGELATQEFDLLIYDDYQGRPEIFQDYRSRCPSLLITHNLRGALEKFPGRGFDVVEKNRPRRAGRRRLDGFIVLSETIRKYCLNNFSPVKPVFWLPDSLHLKNQAIVENHALDDHRYVIGIPGNLTPVRKEYPPIFEMLNSLSEEARKRTEFRFIGGVNDDSGNEVVEKLKQIKEAGANIHFSADLLTDIEFEEKMKRVDMLLLPAPKSILCGDFAEEYNKTKISGTVGHQIRRGLPVIQPDWCPADWHFSSSTLHYANGEDLKNKIESLVENPSELRALKEFALESAGAYTPEKIATHINSTLLNHYFLTQKVAT